MNNFKWIENHEWWNSNEKSSNDNGDDGDDDSDGELFDYFSDIYLKLMSVWYYFFV